MDDTELQSIATTLRGIHGCLIVIMFFQGLRLFIELCRLFKDSRLWQIWDESH
jgi:hypothetical protein